VASLLDLTGMAPPLHWEAIFGFAPRGVELEIGSGKGRFLREQAAARPGDAFIGVERAEKWLRLSVERITRDGRPNVRVVRADAFDLLARWVPLGSISAIHVYFPDPWPKKRHAKRRLLGPALFDLAARAVRRGGRLAIATDVAVYFEAAREVLAAHPCFEEEAATDADREAVRTNYALKYAREGRSFRFACFRRSSADPPPVPQPPTRRSLRGDSVPPRGQDADP
jgi:tRNA (guanine-N7-)-methyltransferase